MVVVVTRVVVSFAARVGVIVDLLLVLLLWDSKHHLRSRKHVFSVYYSRPEDGRTDTQISTC